MTQGSQAKPNTPGALPAGTKLGKYVIVAPLGVGGQSIVYKARDEQLDRLVAIKQISAHVAGDEKFLTRFREVMRLLAKCSSEHVVAVLDLLEEPSGLYVVMEYVEGRTIEQMLAGQAGPIDVKTVLTILWRAAAGLAAIHRAGIVHRDIKPGNIMVAEGMHVKIMDFGVAARLGSAASMRLGTTKYMAPELFAGASSDQRADIYSLGMITYEMLSGRSKFNETFHEIVRDSHSEALRWMKWHSSLDEAARPLTDLNPDVPPALASIVQKMMAKDISHRYQDLETLGRDLRHSFAGRTVADGRGERQHGHKGPHAAAGADQLPSDTAEVTLLPVPEEPRTAEIPKKRMSLGTKLAVAGAITALALAGVVTWWLRDYSHIKDQREKAMAVFNAAESNYAEGAKADTAKEKRARFQQAMEGYIQVAQAFGRSVPTVAQQASVKSFLSKAQLDALDYNRETKNLEKAGEINRQFQRSGKEYAWTQQVEKQLEDFHAYRLSQLDFCQASQDIRKAINEGRLDEAAGGLKKAQGLALLREQVEELQAFGEDIQEKQKQKEYMALVKAGEDKAQLNNVDGALAEYDSALKVIDEALRRHEISDKVYQDLKATAEAKKVAVKNDAAYRDAVAAGEKALLEKNLLEAATAFDRAAAIRPTEGLADKAKEYRYQYYFEQGQANLAAGQLLEAEAALKKAKELKDSPEVNAALAQIDQSRGYQDLVRAGDKLMAAKDYIGALAQYNQAVRVHTDPEGRGKVALATYYLALDEGDKARDNHDWAAAEAAYAKAESALPGKPDVKARLDQVRNEQKYADLLGQAEQARQKGSYGEAAGKLNAAKAIIAKPEITDKINQVRYEENLQLGKQALADQNYTAALAYFRVAKRFVSTPEVDTYIQQAQDGAAKQP